VLTALGKEGEETVFGNLLNEFPKGVLSVVSDSYDIFNACEKIIGEVFHDQIVNRDGLFVVRPDSGDPVSTVLRCLEILGTKFGVTTNSRGFKVLHPKVRLLWGDGLNSDMIYDILFAMKNYGWSAENIVCFGMGGGLLQKVNRDTQRFAFKSCAQCRDGVWHDIWKDPVDKTKASKRGRLALTLVDGPSLSRYVGGTFKTVPAPVECDMLQTVFENGSVIKEYTFDDVRRNAAL
jgi:nicotinamide phosphoribosyltransferase